MTAGGRFISADEVINDTLLGKNLYAYCENNPVNYLDPDGHFTISITTLVVLVVVIIEY